MTVVVFGHGVKNLEHVLPLRALNMRLCTEHTTGANLSRKALGVTLKVSQEEGEENKLFKGLLPAIKFGRAL